MIISHTHRFIFIKTKKTAGSSIEAYLNEYLRSGDVWTDVYPCPDGFKSCSSSPRFWNVIPEILYFCNAKRFQQAFDSLKDFFAGRRYYSHISADRLRFRVKSEIWCGYYKFCVDRDYFDKSISHFYMRKSKDPSLDWLRYIESGDFCINVDHYVDSHDNVLVDEVIAYEKINESLAAIFDRLSIPFNGYLSVRLKSTERKKGVESCNFADPRLKDRLQVAFMRENYIKSTLEKV